MGACGSIKRIPTKEDQEKDQTDVLLDMKMAQRKFLSQVSLAEKEKNKEIQKARKALRENNEESAKLYLQNAATKQQSGQQSLKMAHKLDALTTVLKNSMNSQEMMEKMNKLTPLLKSQSENLNPQEFMTRLQEFQQSMDTLNVQGQLIAQAVHSDQNEASSGIDQMMNNLKFEMQNEIEMNLNVNNTQAMMNELKQNNQNQNMQVNK